MSRRACVLFATSWAHWLIEERLAGLRLPPWLDEGLASLAEADPSAARPALRALAGGILADPTRTASRLRALEHKGYDDLDAEDYALAWCIVRTLRRLHPDGLRNTIDALGDPDRTDRSPRAAFAIVLESDAATQRALHGTRIRHELMRSQSAGPPRSQRSR